MAGHDYKTSELRARELNDAGDWFLNRDAAKRTGLTPWPEALPGGSGGPTDPPTENTRCKSFHPRRPVQNDAETVLLRPRRLSDDQPLAVLCDVVVRSGVAEPEDWDLHQRSGRAEMNP